MTAFVLRYKMRGRPNRARAEEVISRPSIVLGSRPLADIYVADRMVSAEALRLTFDGRRLVVAVIDELAGVFVDAVPVEGEVPVPDGAALQVGHALVEVSIDADERRCVLTTNERYLPGMIDGLVKREKPARPFALEDPGPQEQRWGRSAVLRWSNVAALTLGVLALAAFPFLRNTEAVSRGPLAAAHRPGASDEAPQDCAACHAPFSGHYDGKCAECHEAHTDEARHPYGADVSCGKCHPEHQGGEDFVPAVAAEAPLCVSCHDRKDLDALSVEDRERANKGALAEGGPPVSTPVPFDGFSHKDHLDATPRGGTSAVAPTTPGTLPIDCAKCHVPQAGGERDFAAVTYEQCLECHADWRVPVHGTGDDFAACRTCHDGYGRLSAGTAFASVMGPDIRKATLPATERRYVLRPRGHDFSSDECLACHVLGKRRDDPRRPMDEHVFRHDHHLPTVSPDAGTEGALAAACSTCHASVAASESLGGTPLLDTSWKSVTTTGCASCHTEGEPVAVAAEGPPRTVNDIFHRVHTLDPGGTPTRTARELLDRDCLSCHVPVAGTEPMGLVPGARDCTACHTGHENVGGGKCALCHTDRRPVAGTALTTPSPRCAPGVFDPAKARKRDRRPQPGFAHTSPGHVDVKCAACHDAAAMAAIDSVGDVPLPAPDADACVRCHLERRYHR